MYLDRISGGLTVERTTLGDKGSSMGMYLRILVRVEMIMQVPS